RRSVVSGRRAPGDQPPWPGPAMLAGHRLDLAVTLQLPQVERARPRALAELLRGLRRGQRASLGEQVEQGGPQRMTKPAAGPARPGGAARPISTARPIGTARP